MTSFTALIAFLSLVGQICSPAMSTEKRVHFAAAAEVACGAVPRYRSKGRFSYATQTYVYVPTAAPDPAALILTIRQLVKPFARSPPLT